MEDKKNDSFESLKSQADSEDGAIISYKMMLESAHVQSICLIILAVFAIGIISFLLRNVLIPFVFAVFMTFVLNPVVRFFVQKVHIPRILAIILTFLLSLVLLVGLSIFVSSSFIELANDASRFKDNLEQFVDKVLNNPLLAKYGFSQTSIVNTVGARLAEEAGRLVSVLVSGVFSLLSQGIVVSIYIMFLMFSSNYYSVKKVVLDDNGDIKRSVWDEIRMSIESYIFLKTILSGVMAALTWIILASIGVNMAPVIALLAFAFNFIPNIGPIAASIVPIPIMLLSGHSDFVDMILAVALPGLIHFIVGHLVEPKVMGKTLELDPVVILLGLMIAEVLWGPVGMLLAMPLLVVLRILLDRTSHTRPLVELLSGRLPGTEESIESAKVIAPPKESDQ